MAAGLLSFIALLPSANSLEFDGERYTAAYHSDTPDLRLVEFVRETETIDNWTKLFAIRNFRQLNNPEAAVRAFERTVKQHNPLAGVQTLVKEDGTEAMIDFLTWETGNPLMEFNVHRYLKKPGHPGLVSYQFAFRFRHEPDMDAAKVRSLREHWTALMRAVNPSVEFGQ